MIKLNSRELVMKSNKTFLMILVILFSFTPIQAQIGASLTKTGTTAAQFLKIVVGPRALGMGGAFTATSNDISAVYWNPGGLSRIYGKEATFNHVDWLLDINFDFAAFAIDLEGFGTIGAFVSGMSMGEMVVRTVEKPEGTGENFSAGGLAIGVSYARNLTDNFSIGFNAKYIREHLWHMSSSTFALDIGTLYSIPILNELRIGASISNFGPKMQLSGRDILIITQVGAGEGNLINTQIELDEYELPLIFRFGAALDVIRTSSSRLTTGIDAIHPNDNTEYVNSGFEYSWNEMVFIRAGYKSLFEKGTEQGFTFGVGMNYRVLSALNLKVDYAYQDFGRLKSIHYFSLGLKF